MEVSSSRTVKCVLILHRFSLQGPYFFVYVWMFLSVILLLLMTIYPAFIAPLFDKYIPLPDGELKVAFYELYFV